MEVCGTRKDDMEYIELLTRQAYFVRRGYAHVTMDVRGTGSSSQTLFATLSLTHTHSLSSHFTLSLLLGQSCPSSLILFLSTLAGDPPDKQHDVTEVNDVIEVMQYLIVTYNWINGYIGFYFLLQDFLFLVFRKFAFPFFFPFLCFTWW